MRGRSILPKSHVPAWAQRFIGPDVVGALSLDNVRLKYQVPGRRTDGSLIGRYRIWWLVRWFSTLVVTSFVVLLSVVGFSLGGDIYFGRPYRLVTGQVNCLVLPFADTVRASRRWLRHVELWLIWSDNRIALIKFSGEVADRETIWNAEGSDRPKVMDENLVWPDGSVIQLKTSTT